MKNVELHVGDLVQYHLEASYLNTLGFEVQHVYEVKKIKNVLVIEVGNVSIPLFRRNCLTDYTNHFKLCNEDIALPNGVSK